MKILIIFFLLFTTLFAAPAFNKMRTFTNSDGTTFQAKALGNQHLYWIQTQDGEILKYNQESGDFEYATIKDDSLRASGVRYQKENSKRARSLGHINRVLEEQVSELWQKKQHLHHERKNLSKEFYK